MKAKPSKKKKKVLWVWIHYSWLWIFRVHRSNLCLAIILCFSEPHGVHSCLEKSRNTGEGDAWPPHFFFFIPVRLERVRIWKRQEPMMMVLIKENDSLLPTLRKSSKIITSFGFQTWKVNITWSFSHRSLGAVCKLLTTSGWTWGSYKDGVRRLETITDSGSGLMRSILVLSIPAAPDVVFPGNPNLSCSEKRCVSITLHSIMEKEGESRLSFVSSDCVKMGRWVCSLILLCLIFLILRMGW